MKTNGSQRFGRQLALGHIQTLGELAARTAPHWWKDLLSLWCPSGVNAGDFGLRLAIRNGYLNFYRRGQSIARVEIDTRGTPTATTHIKYLGIKLAGHGKQYVKLQGNRIQWKLGDGTLEQRDYRGLGDLQQWIAHVDKSHVGPEKNCVDKLVAANSNVIDLEMGLPAWGNQKNAPRMDLVAIEQATNGRKLAFWEVKLERDSRIRSKTAVVIDEDPKVLKQLADYRKFLTAVGHAEKVAQAYQNAATLLVQFRAMADGLGRALPLGEEILAAASASASELDIDFKPRLCILKDRNRKGWALDEQKLNQVGVAMQVIETDGSFELSALL